MPEPNTLCPLFVPSVRSTGTPASRSAGMVRSPPPPAIASTKPAARPTVASNSRICGGISIALQRGKAGIIQVRGYGAMGSIACVSQHVEGVDIDRDGHLV